MKAQDDKVKEIRQELYLMKNTFIAKEVEDISENGDASLVIREYPYFNVNDLLTVTKALTQKPAGPLIVLISTRENIVILASSGGHDCGKIVKDNAQVWRGKGGGNATGARAMFPSRDDLDCFITYIRQAYQNRS
jgi:alanyl-tRNA synthetase